MNVARHLLWPADRKSAAPDTRVFLRLRPALWLAFLFLLPFPLSAAPLRVAAWNLETPADGTRPDPVASAAEALRPLSPDIILLQQVSDRQSCAQLAESLKPAEYHLLVCSAFSGPGQRQVAILSKLDAYSAVSQSWRVPGETASGGGYAFAAVQTKDARVGIFCLALTEPLARAVTAPPTQAAARLQAGLAEQWVRAVESRRTWATNNLETVIVSGTFDLPPESAALAKRLADMKFARTFLAAPLDQVFGLDDLHPEGPTASTPALLAIVPDTESLPGVVLDRLPSVCDLNLQVPAKAPPVVSVPAPAPNEPPAAPAPAPPPPPVSNHVVQSETHEIPSLPAPPREPLPARTEAKPAAAPAEPAASKLAAPHSPLSSRPAQAVRGGDFIPVPWWLAVALSGLLGLWLGVRIFSRRQIAPAPAPAPTTPAIEISQSVATISASPLPDASPPAAAALPPPPAPAPAAPVPAPDSPPQPALLERRALEAERKAERAEAIVRAGLLPQISAWLKQKLVRRLIADRADLLGAQENAVLKVAAVDQRLARIEERLGQQYEAYERRIEELTRELRGAKEENRELIRTLIAQLEAERKAGQAQAPVETGRGLEPQADSVTTGASVP